MSEHTPPAENTAFAWTFGSVVFDEGRWELSVNGTPQTLEPKPLEVLAYLLRHAGEVVTKDELLDAVWTGRVVVEAVLTNAVAKLRRALGDEDQSLVATVPRVGYRLMGKVDRRVVKRVLPESRLHAGDAVPRRPNWKLDTRLDTSTNETEVWLARHAKTGEKRVFKFSLDGARLSGLKREATVSRLLQAGLVERDDIVRVIDWDFEDAPYFLECEYGGQDLLVWSDAHDGLASIPLTERIDWLRQIAETVDAAHGLGVLHKDLKPANLLLIEQNGTWRPRVADFGSSALTGAAQLEQFGITNLGFTQTTDASSASGTPYYMAPEVVAGGVATAKSDIYALGVLLYQLITGDLRRPMAPGWESDIEDPLLREDIAKAANGQPDERMASAGELASRLQRLESRRTEREQEERSRVAQAQLASQLRRAKARRPWIAALGLVLIAGLGTSLYLLARAKESEQEAKAQLETAQALQSFMTSDLIGQADPDKTGTTKLSLSDAIDAAEASISDQFADKPRTEAAIRHTLAVIYSKRAEQEKSLTEFTKARQLMQSTGDTATQAFVDTYGIPVQLLTDRGQFDQVKEQLDAFRSFLDSSAHSPAWMEVRYYMMKMSLATSTRRFNDSIDASDAALSFLDRAPEITTRQRDWLRVQRARAFLETGRLEESKVMHEEALAEFDKRPGPKSRVMMDCQQNYIGVLMALGDYDRAYAAIDTLAVDMEQRFGPDYPGMGSVHASMAEGFMRTNRPLDAAESYRKASVIYGKGLGEKSPYTLQMAWGWGFNLRAGGKAREAVDVLAKTYRTAKESLPADSPMIPLFGWDYAYAAVDAQDDALAKSLLPEINMELLNEMDDGDWQARMLLLTGRLALNEGDKLRAVADLEQAEAKLPAIDGDPALLEDVRRYKAEATALP